MFTWASTVASQEFSVVVWWMQNFDRLLAACLKSPFNATDTHLCDFCGKCWIQILSVLQNLRSVFCSALLCAMEPASLDHRQCEALSLSSSFVRTMGCPPEQCNSKSPLFAVFGFSVTRDTTKSTDETTLTWPGRVAPSIDLPKKC